MAGIMEILGQAVSIPIDELKLRSSESDADVELRVGELQKLGLVKLKDTMRSGPDGKSENVQVVELTPKGFKSSIR